MITSPPLYLPGDKVYYTGDKFKDRLNGKPGWIHWHTSDPNVFVVEFPDTRNVKDPHDSDDYVMPVKVLTRQRPHVPEKDTKEKKDGPEIQPRRRRRDHAEEET